MDSGRLSLSGSRPPRWPRTKGAQLFSHPPRPVSREGERDTDRGGRAGGEKGSSSRSGRAGDQILPAAAAAASLLEREEREAAAIDGGGGERRREKKGGGWWWLGSARARRGGGGSRCRFGWPGPSLQRQPNRLLFYPRLPLPISTCTLHDRRGPHLGTRGPVSGAAWPSDAGRDAVRGGHATPLWLSLPLPFFEKEKKSPSAEPHARMALWSPKGRKNSLVFQRKPVVYIIRTKRVEFKFGFRSDVYGLACVACDAEKGGVRTTSCESGSPRRAASSISALLNNRRDQISHQPAAVVIGGI
jgi:hypothetical protein